MQRDTPLQLWLKNCPIWTAQTARLHTVSPPRHGGLCDAFSILTGACSILYAARLVNHHPTYPAVLAHEWISMLPRSI